MLIQVGKTYRNRNGRNVTIVSEGSDDIYPYLGNDGETYTPTGRFLGTQTSSWDLIEEVDTHLTGPLASQKIVFDVAGKPGLTAAITQRLEELGIPAKDGQAKRPLNVNIGLVPGFYVCGGYAAQDSFYNGYRLTTLEELYDLNSWLETPEEEKEEEEEPINPYGRYAIGNNPALSEAIQRRLFELGFTWCCGTDKPLYTDEPVIFAKISLQGNKSLSWAGKPDYQSSDGNNPRTLSDLY